MKNLKWYLKFNGDDEPEPDTDPDPEPEPGSIPPKD
jgi:hypothetical protein